jgi:PAS domain S-box-containing protein
VHKRLARQVRRFFGSEEAVPEEIVPFVAAVGETYRQADDDRELLEHSMDTVSEELIERYERLQEALTESRRAEKEMSAALSLVEATLEATADGILVVDNEGRIVRTNQRFVELWGIPPDVLASRDDDRALAWVLDQLEDPDAFLARVRELYAEPEAESFDTIRFKNGQVLERYSKPQKLGGETVGRVWSFRDLTHRHALEEQLRHSQKMQAVGNLAAGVAHDFNNLLTVIQVHAAELRRDGDLADETLEGIDEIVDAAGRAADVTRQLLAFSRKQILRPVALDLNAVVRDVEPLLRRLLGEDIRIFTQLAEEIGAVVADPGQLGQVVVNLAINARDAMPHGGRLLITTERVNHEDSGSGGSDAVPAGAYGVLTVSDTGHGIPPEDRDRIFEPFFTTKEMGQGTGLGLATVYGIVEQSGGHIRLGDPSDHPAIGSAEMDGRGATFRVYLPITEGPPVPTSPPIHPRQTAGSETILLAEDEPGVRDVIERILARSGYEVLVAGSGQDAANLASEHPGPIDLVLTDVVMPDMGGRELMTIVAQRRPDTPVLFMSGYTDDEVIRRGVITKETPFIQKPFLGQELIHAIREVLDGRPSPLESRDRS